MIDKKIKQIGNIVKTGNYDNPQRGRIYDPSGISSTLNTCGGGGLEVKIVEKKTLCLNSKVNGKQPSLQDRVYSTKGIAPTCVTCFHPNIAIQVEGGEMLIREATKKGYAVANVGDAVNINYPNSKSRRGRVGKGVAKTLTTHCEQAVVESDTRIRKLTPREYGRLQDFSDETFDRLEGISNSQLYKIFGNSITVAVPREAFLLQALICVPGFTTDHSCVNCENCKHVGGNKFYCDVKYKLLAEKGKSTEEYEEDCEEWELKKKIQEVLRKALDKEK